MKVKSYLSILSKGKITTIWWHVSNPRLSDLFPFFPNSETHQYLVLPQTNTIVKDNKQIHFNLTCQENTLWYSGHIATYFKKVISMFFSHLLCRVYLQCNTAIREVLGTANRSTWTLVTNVTSYSTTRMLTESCKYRNNHDTTILRNGWLSSFSFRIFLCILSWSSAYNKMFNKETQDLLCETN